MNRRSVRLRLAPAAALACLISGPGVAAAPAPAVPAPASPAPVAPSAEDGAAAEGKSIAKAVVTVSVRFFVTADGRATQCSVVTGSGRADLDRKTCPLVEGSFRFDTARDSTVAETWKSQDVQWQVVE